MDETGFVYNYLLFYTYASKDDLLYCHYHRVASSRCPLVLKFFNFIFPPRDYWRVPFKFTGILPEDEMKTIDLGDRIVKLDKFEVTEMAIC